MQFRKNYCIIDFTVQHKKLCESDLHDLCVAHGLVDAGKSAHGFLHHLLPHTEHVVLLEELIGELRHTQTGVDLL